MRWIRCVVFSLMGLSQGAFAASVEDLNQFLQNFQNMKANFTQTVADVRGHESVSKGVVWIQKPNQFRWDVKTPNEQLFISDGKTLWNIEPDLDEVSSSPLSQNLSTTPLLLLSGSVKDVDSLFEVQEVEEGQFDLKPKDPDSLVKSLRLSFEDGRIQKIIVVNTLGQTATVVFTQIEDNVSIPASVFEYRS